MTGSGSPNHLVLGVMCSGRRFPRWQAEALRTAMSVPGVSIGLLIVKPRQARSSRSALFRDWRHFLWNLYNKLYVERRSAASAGVDLADELAGVPELVCETVPVGRFGEALSKDDIAAVEAAGLDVIIRFGFGILKGEILDSARFGVWSYHHGDEREYRGQPPGFWEMEEGNASMGAILQRLTERLDSGAVLLRGRFPVYAHSYRRTRDEAFLGSADFLATGLKRLLTQGPSPFFLREPSETQAPIRRSPGNGVMVLFLLRQAAHFVKNQGRGIAWSAKWTIGTVMQSIESIPSGPLDSVDWLQDRDRMRYLADPFPDPTGESGVVLVEDFDQATARGVISAVDLSGDRSPRVVLDPGVHASYPYLFEHDRRIYCTPETHQAGEVRLYEAVSWPDRWEQVATLLRDVEALDPTVIRHDQLWWLFCTMRGPYSNSKLHLYYADDLMGPWTSHPLNPVKTSITGSRPAGTPFLRGGVLHRPAQNCSLSYGGSVTICRIETLTPTDFAEVELFEVMPSREGRYRDGIHTISAIGAELVVVDGRRNVLVLAGVRRELAARWSRLRGTRVESDVGT